MEVALLIETVRTECYLFILLIVMNFQSKVKYIN